MPHAHSHHGVFALAGHPDSIRPSVLLESLEEAKRHDPMSCHVGAGLTDRTQFGDAASADCVGGEGVCW